ncbi:LRR receptor-like serine/threonine-protein kinase [Populus alba x Populus x berolinensis]|nr:LRR receptor-like serine/threonine-protein kinase [Populus alba x Populus x berolinensis]
MGVLSFCLFVFWVSQVVFAQQTTDPNEVDALNRLIDHWNLRDKLNITNDPCIQNAAWANKQANPRVACDCSNNTCHITHLKIHALDISGELPSELFVLKELMNLDFGKNVLNGAIPAEIERLSNMQHLNLGINNFTGAVPQELGNLTKLITLDFGSNNFMGPLPTSLGKLTSLQELYINSSGVSGRIPQEFANLKSLRTLWASDNLFTGKLPDFFGTLTKLRNLRLQGTLLEGPIPSSFSALKKLGDLRIGDLNGEDSSLEFLLDQKSLTILILRNCLLSGQIPDQLGNFSRLQELYLGSNNLNGQLPANIIGPNLIAIDVSFNPLSGNVPQNSTRVGLSMNAVGTSINANNLQGKASGMLQCLKADFKCSNKVPSKTFSVKCGGTDQTSASGIEYEGDLESMGAASLYTSSDNLWADKKRVGKLVGISMACVAGLVIISSVFYLWWIKEDSSQHMRIYTGHPVTKDLPTSECSNPSITG